MALDVTTEVPDELPYVEDFVACAQDQQYGPVLLHNDGDAVWVLSVTDRGHVEFVHRSTSAELFSQLNEGTEVIAPGDTLIIREPPARFTWSLVPSLNVAWETQEEVLEQARSRGEKWFTQSLDRRTPRGAAVAVCTLAALHAAETVDDRPDDFENAFEAGLGLGGQTSECASSWRAAWKERFAPTVEFVEKTEESFRVLNRISRIVGMVR